MTRKEELEKLIRRYDEQYWNGGGSDISDVEYDKLTRELASVDPDNELLTRIPPTSGAKKVVHEKPMLSLAKAYSLEEVMKWCKKVARSSEELFYIQPKYDGLAGKLENGVLSSRGDGKVGEDYSDKLPLIDKEGDFTEEDNLGEILIRDEDFKWMQAHAVAGKSGGVFKNQRNAISGIIGADDVGFYKKIHKQMKADGKNLITFVNYKLHTYSVKLSEISSKWDSIAASIKTAGYPIDGIVVKLADKQYAESLGATDHHPRSAIAFKFTNQSAWTVLRKIEWSIGKDQISAVGEVDPVDISGTTIKHVKLQLTKPVASAVSTYLLDQSLQLNDDVLVERAGDIIPHVVESKPGKGRQPVFLKVCPACGWPIEVRDTSVVCTNPDCNGKAHRKLLYGMSLLGFKGVGPAYAESLLSILGVDTIYKLMTVEEADLRAHKEFGDKLIEIFMTERDKAKKATLATVLAAMDICGAATAKLLSNSLPLDKLLAATEEDLKSIRGVGPISAKEIAHELSSRHDEIVKTLPLFSLESEATPSGKKVCFTGKMEMTRSVMEALAKEKGLQPVDHVDKDTTLVCADPSSTSSKAKKARQLGCKIMSVEEFMNMK